MSVAVATGGPSGRIPDSNHTEELTQNPFGRQAKDDDGGTLPITGANTVVMDMNTLTWTSAGRIFGARYSASATLPFAKNDLTSDIEGQLNGGRGFADSYYVPFILGWNMGRSGFL